MTKQTSKHCKNKQQLNFDKDGLHFAELMEIALDHPIWFLVITRLIKYNVPQKYILAIINKII